MSWSTPIVTIEPASEPITIEQARRQVRISADDTGFDAELTDYIAAARSHVEQYCGTPLVTRTISAQADGFADLARLPVAPVQSVTSIGYVDAAGDEQIVDAAVYRVRSDGLDGASITLAPGQRWPASTGPITLIAVVGYAAIPDDIVHAVKLLTGQFFQAHEVSSAGGWSWVDSLLCNHRAAS